MIKMQFYLYLFIILIKALLKASPFLWWCFLKCFEIRFDVTPIYFQILGSNTASSFNPTLWGSEYTGDGDWKSTGQVIPILDSSYNVGPGILGVYYPKSYDDWSYCKIEGHTLFWYNKTNSSYQYNSKDTTYYWIAF